MKIITAYPIIKNGKVVANKAYNTTLDYSSATGKDTNFEELGTKIGGIIQGAGSVAQSIKTASQKGKKAPAPKPAPVPKPVENKQGMSNTTKVLIGVGAVAVLGTIVYLVTKEK